MSTFKFLAEKATERGCTLQRARDENGCTMAGYVLRKESGLCTRYATLHDVWRYLSKQRIEQEEANG